MEELAALELATELKLITEDDAQLAGEMLSKGINLHVDGSQWLIEIEAKVKEQTKKIKANPYQRYLDGGPKPRSNDGRPDWDAKDQHQALTKQLTELEVFYKLAKERINADFSTTYSSVLETALMLMGVMKALLALPISSQSMTFIQGIDDLRLCFAWSNTSDPIRGKIDTALSFPLFFVFQPVGIMPPIFVHAEC
jgi:hypothetical protein